MGNANAAAVGNTGLISSEEEDDEDDDDDDDEEEEEEEEKDRLRIVNGPSTGNEAV